LFCSFISLFQSVFSEPSRATTQKFKEQNYLETTKKYPIMPDIHITNHGIAKLLSNLDPSTAADPDELKPQISGIYSIYK
jgi:hypothetical protein